jgi:hypothetical protein
MYVISYQVPHVKLKKKVTIANSSMLDKSDSVSNASLLNFKEDERIGVPKPLIPLVSTMYKKKSLGCSPYPYRLLVYFLYSQSKGIYAYSYAKGYLI